MLLLEYFAKITDQNVTSVLVYSRSRLLLPFLEKIAVSFLRQFLVHTPKIDCNKTNDTVLFLPSDHVNMNTKNIDTRTYIIHRYCEFACVRACFGDSVCRNKNISDFVIFSFNILHFIFIFYCKIE